LSLVSDLTPLDPEPTVFASDVVGVGRSVAGQVLALATIQARESIVHRLADLTGEFRAVAGR
jgi:hypothetical protein